MKLGNIREIVRKIAEGHKKVDDEEYNSDWLYRSIQKRPQECLEEFYQKKFNKNVDYDQWVGIRDELDRMGGALYERTLTILGDAIFLIRHTDQNKIDELERDVEELNKEKERLEKELKKYRD